MTDLNQTQTAPMPYATTKTNTGSLVLPHVHTNDCWRESLPCALEYIRALENSERRLEILCQTLQGQLRQMRSMIDKMDANITKACQ